MTTSLPSPAMSMPIYGHSRHLPETSCSASTSSPSSPSSSSSSSSSPSSRCGVVSCSTLCHRRINKWEEPIAHMCFPPINAQQAHPVVAGTYMCDAHYEMMAAYQRDVERHMEEMASGHQFSPNEHHTTHTHEIHEMHEHEHDQEEHHQHMDDTTPLISTSTSPSKSAPSEIAPAVKSYSTFDEYPPAELSLSSPSSTISTCDPSASFCSRLLYCHSQQATNACTQVTKECCPKAQAKAQKQVSIEIPQDIHSMSRSLLPASTLSSCLSRACTRERAACAAMNMGYAMVVVFFTLLILLSVTGITKRLM